ncbi:MAG: ASPIC/UnbV domain-containing protein, partial [Planctomycetales bacterium]|nr:ASPIC/UnbV domain-containing protein [Planctomycetales bacterium]
MSRTANDESTDADRNWFGARNDLFRMIMEGRSFSGRERNCCFLNTGDGKFATVSAVAGIDFPDDGRALTYTDWDHDGDLDLWITNRTAPRIRYLENQTVDSSQAVTFHLVGNGTTTNRDAVGARIEVRVSDQSTSPRPKSPVTSPQRPQRLVKTLRAGEGFLSQSSKSIHVGLGQTAGIEQVTVHWPGGTTETFEDVERGGKYELRQGTGIAARLPTPAPRSQLTSDTTPLPDASRTGRVSLVNRVPMPSVALQNLTSSETRRLDFKTGRPTLLLLWASWCSPCIQELATLTGQQRELQQANIDIVAINVDQLDDPNATLDNAQQVVAQLGDSITWGQVDANQMQMLQELNDQFFFLKKPLPLPSSFLVDASGRLAAIYKGPIEPTQLLADSQRIPGDYHERARSAACLPGSSLEHPRIL